MPTLPRTYYLCPAFAFTFDLEMESGIRQAFKTGVSLAVNKLSDTLTIMRIQTVLLFMSLVLPMLAQAEIYKYVDENGQVTFTDVYRRGAKRVDLPGAPTTLPNSGGSKPQKRAYSPADFPRIDAATQKKRDDIRRQVLEDEVSAERQNADEARRQLALGERLQLGERATDSTYLNRVKKLRDTVAQHEQNVSAIQREITNLK